MRRRVSAARVARLATIGPDGAPHLVPITFALSDDTVYLAVDDKPKTTTRLQRVANIERDPRVSVLVDHYDDDWSALWWVRLDGTGRIAGDDEATTGIAALRVKYETYRDQAPKGPVIAIAVTGWLGWSAR